MPMRKTVIINVRHIRVANAGKKLNLQLHVKRYFNE
jgi:hypothetical protein